MSYVCQILQYTPSDHPDHNNLQEALVKANEICSQVNEGVQEKDNSDKLEWIQTHVLCDGLTEVKPKGSGSNWTMTRASWVTEASPWWLCNCNLTTASLSETHFQLNHQLSGATQVSVLRYTLQGEHHHHHHHHYLGTTITVSLTSCSCCRPRVGKSWLDFSSMTSCCWLSPRATWEVWPPSSVLTWKLTLSSRCIEMWAMTVYTAF